MSPARRSWARSGTSRALTPGSRRSARGRRTTMPELDGVFIPVPTPFRGGEVAYDRLQENLVRWNETALRGYVLLGSTGEVPMVTEDERGRILAPARAAIPPGE